MSLYSTDVCRLLGLVMACGEVGTEDSSCYLPVLSVSFVRSFLPVDHMYREIEWLREPKPIIRLTWKSTAGFPIDRHMLYNNTGNKRIPQEVKTLPLDKQLVIIQAFIEGSNVTSNGEPLSINERQLAKDIAQLLNRQRWSHTVKKTQPDTILIFDAAGRVLEKPNVIVTHIHLSPQSR